MQIVLQENIFEPNQVEILEGIVPSKHAQIKANLLSLISSFNNTSNAGLHPNICSIFFSSDTEPLKTLRETGLNHTKIAKLINSMECGVIAYIRTYEHKCIGINVSSSASTYLNPAPLSHLKTTLNQINPILTKIDKEGLEKRIVSVFEKLKVVLWDFDGTIVGEDFKAMVECATELKLTLNEDRARNNLKGIKLVTNRERVLFTLGLINNDAYQKVSEIIQNIGGVNEDSTAEEFSRIVDIPVDDAKSILAQIPEKPIIEATLTHLNLITPDKYTLVDRYIELVKEKQDANKSKGALEPLSGVLEFISDLKDFTQGIATNAWTKPVVDWFGIKLAGIFDSNKIVATDHAELNELNGFKPNPYHYQLLKRQLIANNSKLRDEDFEQASFAIEDSLVGLASALRAKTPCFLVSTDIPNEETFLTELKKNGVSEDQIKQYFLGATKSVKVLHALFEELKIID